VCVCVCVCVCVHACVCVCVCVRAVCICASETYIAAATAIGSARLGSAWQRRACLVGVLHIVRLQTDILRRHQLGNLVLNRRICES
jgi:hypothetical protein